MTTVQLPKPISVNRIWRNAGRTLVSREYKAWKQQADALLTGAPRPCIDVPVHIEIQIGSKELRSNADIDNCSKAYLDTLVRNQILKDDNAKIVQSLHMRLVPGLTGAIARIVKLDAERGPDDV